MYVSLLLVGDDFMAAKVSVSKRNVGKSCVILGGEVA